MRSCNKSLQQKNPTIAEVGQQDRWEIAELGVVCVSSDRLCARRQLAAVIEWLYQNRPDLDISRAEIELL